MGLFSRRKLIGNMELSFASREIVSVSDTIPEVIEKGQDAHTWFAFHFAAKLFTNHPGLIGQAIAAETYDRLVKQIGKDVESRSMLGASGSQIGISSTPVAGVWEYSGAMYVKGSAVLVDSKIAHGDEEYFHRAAVEVAFEIARKHRPKSEPLFTAASSFFDCLRQMGTSSIRENYTLAHRFSALSDGS
jgi:hypothetical protein